MSGFDINEDIKEGLADIAQEFKTGQDSDYQVIMTRQELKRDPINGDSIDETVSILKDAIFTEIDSHLIDGQTIKTIDRELVCNGDVIIQQGDMITNGPESYKVEAVETIKPFDVVITQVVRCRPSRKGRIAFLADNNGEVLQDKNEEILSAGSGT